MRCTRFMLPLSIWLLLSQRAVGQTPKVFTLNGHSNAVMAVTFSPDGKVLASGGADNVIRLWDMSRGAELAVFRGHSGNVKSLSFSQDGKLLASGAYDSNVRIWEVETRALYASLPVWTTFVHEVAFSPDGKWLVTRTGFDGVLRIWDVAQKKQVRAFPGFKGQGRQVGFSADGRLATVSDQGVLRISELATGKTRFQSKGARPESNVVFSTDGKLFGFDNGLWDAESYKRLGRFATAPAALSQDAGVVVVTEGFTHYPPQRPRGVAGGNLIVLDLATGKRLLTHGVTNPRHAATIFSASLSPDARWVAIGTGDFRVMLFDIGELRGKVQPK